MTAGHKLLSLPSSMKSGNEESQTTVMNNSDARRLGEDFFTHMATVEMPSSLLTIPGSPED